MEARAQLDRDMISELQADGVLGQERQAQMDEALKSSRTIGAAIGLIMASRHVTEVEAFEVLRTASRNSNRKLRDLAAELVASAGLIDPSR
jgi:AmiR/NasT family two-component response regulator